MKREQYLFKYLMIIVSIILLSINGYAQETTIKESFGDITDADGNCTMISVNNSKQYGKELILISFDKRAINRVLLSLSKADANKLVGMVEKAVADLAKPVQLAKNQSIDKEFGTVIGNGFIHINAKRLATLDTYLYVSNTDSVAINIVSLSLRIGQAKQYLSLLQKAVKKMN